MNRETGKGPLWHGSVLGDTGQHWERNPAEGPGQGWGTAHLPQGLYNCALESAAWCTDHLICAAEDAKITTILYNLQKI